MGFLREPGSKSSGNGFVHKMWGMSEGEDRTNSEVNKVSEDSDNYGGDEMDSDDLSR